MLSRALLFILSCLVLVGCSAPALQRTKTADCLPPPPGETLYVVPFLAVMVPPAIEAGILDRLVDTLNRAAPQTGREVVIVKRPPAEIDPEWLSQRHYLGGEIFGFVRDSGCCSTELRLKARLTYHQPGASQPTLTLTLKRETFFDHDSSNLELEQERLIDEVVAAFAGELLPFLTPSEKNPPTK